MSPATTTTAACAMTESKPQSYHGNAEDGQADALHERRERRIRNESPVHVAGIAQELQFVAVKPVAVVGEDVKQCDASRNDDQNHGVDPRIAIGQNRHRTSVTSLRLRAIAAYLFSLRTAISFSSIHSDTRVWHCAMLPRSPRKAGRMFPVPQCPRWLSVFLSRMRPASPMLSSALSAAWSLMRILTRYILREVTAHALIGVAIFTFVLFTRDLGRILELVVRASAPLPSVAEIFFFTVPLALTYTLPMSVLVGILIGLSRLAADSEITAMRASGMGVWSFLRVLSIFVLAAWLLALANGLYIAPAIPGRSRTPGRPPQRLAGFVRDSAASVLTRDFPRICSLRAGREERARRGRVERRLHGRSDRRHQPEDHAGQGRHCRQRRPDRLHLHLIDGSEHETDPKDRGHYQISTFQQTDIPIDLPSDGEQARRVAPASADGDAGSAARKPIASIPFPLAGISSNFIGASPCRPPAWCWRWSESR